MNEDIEKRLKLIRDTASILRYGGHENGGITIHPHDYNNFNKAMSIIDDAAREIAIILSK